MGTGILEQDFGGWMCFLTKPARIRKEMLESGNLFSGSLILLPVP